MFGLASAAVAKETPALNQSWTIEGYGRGYASSGSISGERLAVGAPEANSAAPPYVATGAEFGATFSSLDDLGFITERAMYVSRSGVTFLGGHASAGVTAPSARWFFAEGATTWTFDEFLLLANPAATPARGGVTELPNQHNLSVAAARRVARGARADITNASKIEGVMLGGRWLPRTENDRRLAALVAPR